MLPEGLEAPSQASLAIQHQTKKLVRQSIPKKRRKDHPQEVGIHKEDKHTHIHASQLLELPNLLHKTEAEWVGGREPPYAPVAAQAGVVELKTST